MFSTLPKFTVTYLLYRPDENTFQNGQPFALKCKQAGPRSILGHAHRLTD
jgi:hypothetical protein